ncbi:MAG: hypothetical protein OJJ54_18980, partial [Pseudonocardia sp.]|nr:hypothetical protein [Pseudonocardia sp.]
SAETTTARAAAPTTARAPSVAAERAAPTTTRPRATTTAREPAPTAAGGSGCSPNYSPCLPITRDLNCSDVVGTVRVLGTDVYGLDRNKDGIGCE